MPKETGIKNLDAAELQSKVEGLEAENAEIQADNDELQKENERLTEKLEAAQESMENLLGEVKAIVKDLHR